MNEKPKDLPAVLYIAGYGRSGSTLLDTLLGSHARILGAGELSSIFEDRAANRNCSCGQTLTDCPFWRDVFDRVAAGPAGFDLHEAAAVTRGIESIHRPSPAREKYNRLWQSMLRAMRAVSEADLVVDSSKSARTTCGRLPALQAAGIPVKGVHLVRDPRAVMWSIQRGSNRKLERGGPARLRGGMLRGMTSWCLVNAGVDRMRRRHPEIPMLRITYEQLIRDPDDTLNRIGAHAGVSLEPVLAKIRNGEDIDPGHGVAGNRMRRKGRIVLTLDEEWKASMPGWAKALAGCTGPLRHKYQLD